ncbi:hypothetical protein Tco_0240799 [Tanacetum coccineum]
MNMLNRNCKTSFVKPEFLKKAQRAILAEDIARRDNLSTVDSGCSKHMTGKSQASNEILWRNFCTGHESFSPCSSTTDLIPYSSRLNNSQSNCLMAKATSSQAYHVSSDPIPQCPATVFEHDSLSLDPQSPENVPQVANTVTTSNELELLYSPMFSELLNGTSHVVSKSSAVRAADNPEKR